MSLELIRNVGGRGRALGLGAIVALACSACASEEVASVPAGAGYAPPVMATSDSPKKVAAAPMGYPWMNPGGPSLPTASANAPVIR